jgi:DNA sulfur modification protein DndD
VDNERQTLTRLLHTARNDFQEHERGGGEWIRQFESVETNRLNVIKLREAAEKELAFCEQKLKEISQAEIEEKRSQRDALSSSLREKEEERRDLQVEERDLSRTIAELEEKFRSLTEADRKLRTLNARLTVAKDVVGVIEGSLSELQQVYLRRVSDRMRDLFLEMIGADPEQGSLFQDARITDTYEIVVRTRDGRLLNPDYELNGASQRALTFAFIWALTEVSGVIAPRVIDTPLGMMSGAVKRRVLEIISRPSTGETDGESPPEPEKQVILFLTRSEISHTEDILDNRVTNIATLTNTDHYPVDLVNKPAVDSVRIVTCRCDHRHVCAVCQRKGDEDYGLAVTQASAGGA